MTPVLSSRTLTLQRRSMMPTSTRAAWPRMGATAQQADQVKMPQAQGMVVVVMMVVVMPLMGF